MKRVGLIVAVGLLLAVLLWRHEPAPAPPAKAAPVTAERATPTLASAAPLPADVHELPENDQLEVVDRSHELIQAAGRVCWDGRMLTKEPPPGHRDETTQYLRLELELVAVHGLVRVTAPHVVESGMTDAALERCIVDGLARIEFAARVPDGRVGVKELLRMGEFTRPRPRAAGELPADLPPPPPPPPPGTPPGTTLPVRAGARLAQ